MIRTLLITGVLLLGACAATPSRVVEVYVVSQEELAAGAEAAGVEHNYKALGGYALWGGFKGAPCRIFVTPEWTRTNIMTHEMRHCFEGDFHP